MSKNFVKIVRFMSIASIRPCVSKHNAQDKYIGQMILRNPNSIDIITHIGEVAIEEICVLDDGCTFHVKFNHYNPLMIERLPIEH